MLRDQGLELDRAGLRRRSVHRARASPFDPPAFNTSAPAGESEFGDLPPTEFLAWTDTQSQARVLALNDKQMILEASPFYPEGGGQVGDAGLIRTPGGLFVVDDTRFDAAGHIVHYGRVTEGEINPASWRAPKSTRRGATDRAATTRPRTCSTARSRTSWAKAPVSRAPTSARISCASTSTRRVR